MTSMNCLFSTQTLEAVERSATGLNYFFTQSDSYLPKHRALLVWQVLINEGAPLNGNDWHLRLSHHIIRSVCSNPNSPNVCNFKSSYVMIQEQGSGAVRTSRQLSAVQKKKGITRER